MNRRQAKKNFKKKYGYNPPRDSNLDIELFKNTLDALTDMMPCMCETITNGIKATLRYLSEVCKQINEMPKEKLIKLLEISRNDETVG